MHRAVVVALCLCLFAQPTLASPQPLQETLDPDDVSITVHVDEDGNAEWEIEYRKRLETENDKEIFEGVATDIEENRSEFRTRFHNRMNATAADAAENTGREMAIADVAVSAERRGLPQHYGVITYTFQWQNFAATADGRILIGDAIDGMFLDEESSLVVEWPEGYELETSNPQPDSVRSVAVVWEGPIDFTGGEPRVAAASDTAAGGLIGVSIPPLFGAGAFTLLALSVVAYVSYRWQSRNGGTATVADTELMSNEEQVVATLEANGGRLKQQEIAEALEWSDTKTSDVIKRLREEETIEGFRLGRQNVIRLPENDDI